MDFTSFLKNPSTIIFIIIIIIVIVMGLGLIFFKDAIIGILPSFLKKFLGLETFVIMKNPSMDDIFDETVRTIIHKIMELVRQYNTNISIIDQDAIKINLYEASKKYYVENPTREVLIEKYGDFIIEQVAVELKKLNIEASMAMIEEMKKNLIPQVKLFLSYTSDSYQIPGVEFKEGRLKEYDLNTVQNGYVPPVITKDMKGNYKFVPNNNTINPIVDKVMKDHSELITTRPYVGYNTYNLIAGIKKYGFANYTRGNYYWNPRGLPKSLILKL